MIMHGCSGDSLGLRFCEFLINFGVTSMNSVKFCLILLAVAISVACGQTAPPPNATIAATNVPQAVTSTPASTAKPVDEIAAAANIYTTNCMICHKDSGKGGRLTMEGKSINPDDLTTAKMKGLTDEKLKGYVINGIPEEGMPAFKDKLSGDEIEAVIRHVRTLQK